MEEIKQTNEKPEETETREAPKTAEEIMEDIRERAKRGTLALSEPIEDGENSYDELEYDFTKLKGLEITRAIDSGRSVARTTDTNFRLTDEQALHLFAAAAEKCQKPGGLDRRDIVERMGAMDSIVAVQAASLFFNVSSQGGRRTTGRK